MGAATLFVHNVSILRGFRKIILGVIKKWSSEAALNFKFYPSDWHFRLAQFTAVLISNTASDGDYTPSILPGGKNLGQPRPSTVYYNADSLVNVVIRLDFRLDNILIITLVDINIFLRNWYSFRTFNEKCVLVFCVIKLKYLNEIVHTYLLQLKTEWNIDSI